MSDFIVPDQIHVVPIVGGELKLSPSHDFLHHFERNGAWILKYWNCDAEPPHMSNVLLNAAAAQFLIDSCGIEVCERKRMGEQEHEQYLEWATLHELQELDFDDSGFGEDQ